MSVQIQKILLALLPVLMAITGCGRVTHGEGAPRHLPADRLIRVIATTNIVADLVRNIGGERIQLQNLMGPGVDPHLYKASEGDVLRMAEADIIFYNGLHLEGKMVDVLEKIEHRKITVAITDTIPRDSLLAPPEFAGNYDPHIWFDVRLWMLAAEYVQNTFIRLDTAHAHIYRRNGSDYLAHLKEIHQYVKKQAARTPADKRVLITAHDAFNYFGQAYNFDVRGLQGISTVAETGTRDIQELAEFIVEREIPAIFVETSVSPRYIEALKAAVQARGFKVRIGGNLFSDALGTAGTPEGTYLGMVRHNIDTIVNALLTKPGVKPLTNRTGVQQ